MLTGIIGKSIARRRRRKLLSLVAVALGITVTTAVGTIALDVGDRVSRELRSFGANIRVTPAADTLSVVVGGVDYRPAGAGAFLSEADLVNLKKIFWRNNIAAFAPFLDVPVRLETRSAAVATVAVGSWFDHRLEVTKSETFETGLKELHPAWRVEGEWPSDYDPAACLVGRRLAMRLGVEPGKTLVIASPASPSDGGHVAHAGLKPGSTGAATLTVRGVLDSGGPEDDQILVPLKTAQKMAGTEGKVRRIEVSAVTKPEDAFARSDPSKMSPEQLERWSCSPYARSIAYQIQQALPGAEARPVYQAAESEGRILGRVALLMGILVAAGLVTAALGVSSMMLATVLERRSEIGLFKALGATDARVAAVFLLEACVLGALGGVVGYFAGSWLASRLALSVFGVPSSSHWVLFPAVVALAVTVALVGSALPLARALKISPAVALRE